MTITATRIDARLAAVHLAPAWWERWLLGRRERTMHAVAIPDIGGSRCWIDDHTNRRIADQRVLHALDQLETRTAGEQRLAVTARRTT